MLKAYLRSGRSLVASMKLCLLLTGLRHWKAFHNSYDNCTLSSEKRPSSSLLNEYITSTVSPLNSVVKAPPELLSWLRYCGIGVVTTEFEKCEGKVRCLFCLPWVVAADEAPWSVIVDDVLPRPSNEAIYIFHSTSLCGYLGPALQSLECPYTPWGLSW